MDQIRKVRKCLWVFMLLLTLSLVVSAGIPAHAASKSKGYTYTIRFKKNGVITTAPKKMKCVSGKKYRLPGSDEKGFGSWNTKKDGSGKTYRAGQKVKNLGKQKGQVITLYANAFYGKNNIEKITRYFVRQGYSKQAAAAIAGNLMYESGGGASDIRLNAVEYKTGRGIGMVQWTDTSDGARRTNFENFCRAAGKPWPNQDLKVQVDFLQAELKGDYGKIWQFMPRMGYPEKYRMSLKKFKKCKNLELATGVFCACFERPYMEGCGLSTRIYFAQIALAALDE